MYAYITLKFEITPEEIEEHSTAQNAAANLSSWTKHYTQADDIVKVEVKDD